MGMINIGGFLTRTALGKVLLYGTGILFVVVLLHGTIQSAREKSLRPLITEVGTQLLSPDVYLYNEIKDLEANPEQISYNAAYLKLQ